MFKAKARAGFRVTIVGNQLILKDYKKELCIPISAVKSALIQKSTYDLPFLEKTVKIYTDGGNWTIKRLPKKKAKELYQLLTSANGETY
jgi:hypothetical protein